MRIFSRLDMRIQIVLVLFDYMAEVLTQYNMTSQEEILLPSN